MRILFPVQVFYPSQAGGPANSVYWLAKSLKRHGIEPVVVATDDGLGPGTERNAWSEGEAGKVIFVRTRVLYLPFFQILLALRELLRSDAVQISSMFFPTAFIVGVAARLLGKPLVWSPRGELDPAALAISPARKRPVLSMLRILVGRYPLYHSTCEAETGYIRTHFGVDARVREIPNLIEMPPPKECAPGGHLLYIGRLHSKKAVDNLIRALALSESFRASGRILKIAGQGKAEYQELLAKLADELNLSDRIEFLGQIEGEAKQELLASAWFTIMPSHTENFGIVVLESLAQASPVIASRGTPWESLEREGVGFWVDNSPESLAGALDRAVGLDSGEYALMRRKARPFVEREFEIESNIGRWTETYRSLI